MTRNAILAYQRHRDRIEDALVAAALALLVGLFLDSMGSYPGQWRTVLLLAIFGLGTQRRAWGYYAAVATLVWPLWLLSPYLLTLFLAVALLPREWIVGALPWALVVASAPLLAEWQVIGLVPLLAGLLAGPTTGLWAGVFAALWLKLAAGLAGWVPELGALHGVSFGLALVQSRVAEASSLETLRLLAEPFAQGASALLLHVLQIGAWGLAGWLVGRVRALEWRGREPQLPLVPPLATGALVLWGAIFVVPAWLGLQPLSTFLVASTPSAGLALSALTAALATTIYESIQQPLPRRVAPQPRTVRRMGREGMITVVEDAKGRPRRGFEPPRPTNDDDDVIMLELD